MRLYICLFYDKSAVLQAKSIKADRLDSAVKIAADMCRTHPECGRYELWQGGHKVHQGEPRA